MNKMKAFCILSLVLLSVQIVRSQDYYDEGDGEGEGGDEYGDDGGEGGEGGGEDHEGGEGEGKEGDGGEGGANDGTSDHEFEFFSPSYQSDYDPHDYHPEHYDSGYDSPFLGELKKGQKKGAQGQQQKPQRPSYDGFGGGPTNQNLKQHSSYDGFGDSTNQKLKQRRPQHYKVKRSSSFPEDFFEAYDRYFSNRFRRSTGGTGRKGRQGKQNGKKSERLSLEDDFFQPTDENYEFNYDFSPSKEYDRIKAISDKQTQEIQKNPELCKEVLKSGQVCTVCYDPSTDAESESCAYSAELEPKNFAYAKQTSFAHKNSKPLEQDEIGTEAAGDDESGFSSEDQDQDQYDDEEVEEKPQPKPAQLKKPNQGGFARFNDHYTNFKPATVAPKPNARILHPHPPRPQAQYRQNLFGEPAKPLRAQQSHFGHHQKPQRSQQLVAKPKPVIESVDDSPFGGFDPPRDSPSGRSYFGSPSHYPAGKPQQRRQATVVDHDEPTADNSDEKYPNYAYRYDVDAAVAEFNQRDWSLCQGPVLKDHMTCYQCKDEFGVRNEECMFVSASNPKGVRVPFEKTDSHTEASDETVVRIVRKKSQSVDPTEVESRTVERRVSFTPVEAPVLFEHEIEHTEEEKES